MKVKLITQYAGPRGNCGPGCVIDVPSDEADALISGGFAERAEKAKPKDDAPSKGGKKAKGK